ncbi:toll-like receptor 2 [Diadema antillarum]|uniref:toll-like receptor 2 n=1 Tax=Diadema antillarum TaxID=105358 RepID=UPI003A876901
MDRMDSAPLVLFILIHGLISLSAMETVSAAAPPCLIDRASRGAYCYGMGLSSVPGHLPGNTEILDLSFNKIAALYNTSCFAYKQLKDLVIESNDISFIDSGTFLGLSFLQSLDLSNNKRLPALRGDMFASTALTNIQLNGSNLAHVSDDIFRAMTTTSTLGLRNNILQNVSWTACHVAFLSMSLTQNKFTELSEKSFAMDCNVDSLDLSYNPIQLISPATISSLKVRGLDMSGILLPEKELHHLFEDIHFIGYREIVPQQQREDFQYDMYVVNHDEDEVWTEEIFRRGLEENLPEYGRLAVGDEALRLGMYYLDSVSLLVENSFKVVFLISADALKNHMFLLKFRLALDHVNEVQIENIVLVFLEEIPDADLPFLIRLFLSDNRVYLMWPRDPGGQPYFWEKLGKYMTVNRYCNPLVPP